MRFGSFRIVHRDRLDEPRQYDHLGTPRLAGQEHAERVLGDARGKVRVADRADEHLGGLDGELSAVLGSALARATR